jgi:hypothetical protein
MSWWCRLIACAVILLALGACGVRGDLDPPPDSAKTKSEPFILDKII